MPNSKYCFINARARSTCFLSAPCIHWSHDDRLQLSVWIVALFQFVMLLLDILEMIGWVFCQIFHWSGLQMFTHCILLHFSVVVVWTFPYALLSYYLLWKAKLSWTIFLNTEYSITHRWCICTDPSSYFSSLALCWLPITSSSRMSPGALLRIWEDNTSAYE